MNDIDIVFEKWFIDKEKKLWDIGGNVRDIQHLVDMVKEVSSQNTFSKFRTQREGFTAGEEYGSKQARIDTLDEILNKIEKKIKKQFFRVSINFVRDILKRSINKIRKSDTELAKLRSE